MGNAEHRAGAAREAESQARTDDRTASGASASGTATPAPTRVVQIIDSLGMGGAERVLAQTAPRLARLGLDVRVVVLQERNGNPLAEPLQRSGIPVELIRIDRLRNLAQVRTLLATLRSLRPDILHGHLEFAGILASIAGRRLGIPSVVTLHTLDAPTGLDRKSLHLRLMNRVLGHMATTVVCLTESARATAKTTPLRRTDLVVLANGVDLEPWRAPPRQDRAALRNSLGIPAGAPLIATVAVLRPEKGIAHLINAMPAVMSRHGDARLLIVGDGADRAALQGRVGDLGLDGQIVFAGVRDDVPDLLRAADCFVLPTLGDALPTVIMEAMAASLPIVASATGGVPEMIRDGKEGLLVEPGNEAQLAAACIRILDDPEVARSLAAAGRRRVEQSFNLDRQVQRQSDLYSRLLSRR
jgi:glycosyltransferase involved in cell wall biosynthesis